jgi:hypothetical protein
MITKSCAICDSPLRVEIETKDSSSKARETVQWARNRGVNISCLSLAKHRANHLNGDGPVPNDTGTQGSSTVQEFRPSQFQEDGEKAARGISQNIEPLLVTDHLVLDTVRNLVYKKLVDGELELKIDSAFKAIELKYKIQEASENEKLLIEILNEIRGQELRKVDFQQTSPRPIE